MKNIYFTFLISLTLLGTTLYANNTITKSPQKKVEVGTLPGRLSITPMGNAVYKIPIEVPPGIGNMTPKLSFTYNSGIKGSIMGYGWTLSGLSRISRSPETYYYNGAPKEIDFSNDQLVLDGKKIILTNQNSNEYRFEEDNMDRIIKYYLKGKENNIYFIDYTKLGLIKTYGKTLQSKLIYGNENNPALIYFINKIEDQDGNSIKYNYESHQNEGTVYIKSIEYGGTSRNRDISNYVIEFEYIDADLAKTSFYSIGGEGSRFKYREDKLLKKVIIKYRGEELRRYTLNYVEGGILNEKHLKSITLETPESEYKSTVFNWKYTQNSMNKTSVVYNHNIDPKPLQYRTPFIGKGDFNNDGISDLIVYNIYKDIQPEINLDLYISNGTSFTHKLHHKFNNQLNYIGCGDFNGDGTSEILFKDSNGFYKIVDFIYEPETDSYSITEHNNLFNSDFTSGFIGDFNGDGIDDLITYDSTGTGNIHYYKGDINNYLEDSNIEDYYVGIKHKIYTGDFDGGRKTELLVADGNIRKFIKIKLNYDNNDFEQHTVELTNTPTNLYENYFSEKMPLLVLGDYNNDGKTDIIATSNDKDNNNLDLYFSYGYDFEFQKTIIINKDGVIASDVNGDGRSDIIIFKHENDNWYNWTNVTYYYVKRDGKSLTKGPTFKLYYNDNRDATILGSFLFGKYTGTNKKDLIVSSYTVGNISDDIDFEVKAYYYGETTFSKLTKITNGLGTISQIKYEPLPTSQHYETNPDYIYNYPLIKYNPTKFIVTKLYKDNGQGGFFEPIEYYYKNGITHKRGKGFLGFMCFTENNKKNNISDVKQYDIFGIDQLKFFKRYIKSETNYIINDNGEIGQKIIKSEIALNYKKTTSNNLIFFPYAENILTDYYTLKSGEKYKTVLVNNTDYDIYGNVGKTIITKTGYSPGCKTYITESLFKYWNDPKIENNKWVIGKLIDVSTTKKFKDETIKPIIKHTIFDYYDKKNKPFFGKLKSKAFAPEDNKAMETKYTEYDEYGNLLSFVNNAYKNPNSDLERINSFEYDDSYFKRFVTKTINPLGHETLYEYNRTWGWITKITESGNIETTIRYINDFGNQFMKILPDMTFYQLNYFWVSDDDEDKPEYSIYYKYETSSAYPGVKTYYDKLNRKLRIVTSNSSGVIYRDFYYDHNTGKLSFETKPYFRGDDIYKIHYEYDKLGRIIGKYLPGDRDYYYSYDGLTLTISNPKRQTITEIFSVNNDLVSVINDLNICSLYAYDPDGRIISAMIRNKEKTEIKATYDIYGNITSIIDPALGEKKFEYDAFGQLVKVTHNNFVEQKDFKYDKLGRILEKDEPEVGHTNFYYDSQFDGRLDEIYFSSHNNEDWYETDFSYDLYARVTTINENINHNSVSNVFSTNYTYSRRTGQLETLQYPSGLKIYYEYYNGDVIKIKRMSDDKVLWSLDKKNAMGQLEFYSYGNGVYTAKSYYPETGLIKNIFSSQPMLSRDFGHQIQNNSYTWDRLGNLLSRKKEFEMYGNYLMEEFQYDNLNRLTKDIIIKVENKQSWSGEIDLAYDELNRILKKQSSDPDLHVADKYNYDDEGRNPYKLISIDNKPAFYYGKQQTIQYTKFDKINRIYQTDEGRGKVDQKLEIYYDFNHQRKIQTFTDFITKFAQTKYYLAGGLAEFVEEQSSNPVKDNDEKMISYLFAPDGLFAIDTRYSSGEGQMYYVHKDHLGSIEALTDESGKLIEEYSYDAWGMRRDPKTWKPLTGIYNTKTNRGFTGHEHLDVFNMINMNGRMYDPVIGYFSSPDPIIGIPVSPQSFNLYVYTHNNPLSRTDPTGYYDEINDIGAQGLAYSTTLPDTKFTDIGKESFTSSTIAYTINLPTFVVTGKGGSKIKLPKKTINIKINNFELQPTITENNKQNNNSSVNNDNSFDSPFDFMNDNSYYDNDAQGYSDYNNNTQAPAAENGYESNEAGESGEDWNSLPDWKNISDAQKILQILKRIKEAAKQGEPSVNLREIFINFPEFLPNAGLTINEKNMKFGKYETKISMQLVIYSNMSIETYPLYNGDRFIKGSYWESLSFGRNKLLILEFEQNNRNFRLFDFLYK